MGGLQNRVLAARLARGSDELMKNVRDEFRRTAKHVADETRARILAASSKHPGPLRAEIAATVTVRTYARGRAGVQAEIRSEGSRMPPETKAQNVPAYANAGQARWLRWRHPVFADSEKPRKDWTWVPQEWPSARGWFDGTIRAAEREFTDAAEMAMEETSAYLEGR